MARVTWVGPGGGDWSQTPVDGDDGVFGDLAQSLTTGLSGVSGVNWASLTITPEFRGDIGTPNAGLQVEASGTGRVINRGSGRLVHLTAGAVEDVGGVNHSPAAGGEMVLTAMSAGAISAHGGRLVMGEDVLGDVFAGGTALVRVLGAPMATIGFLRAVAEAQVELHRDVQTSLQIGGRATVAEARDDLEHAGLRMTGGRLVKRGGTLTTPLLHAGVLDCSRATADVAVTGGGELGQDLVIIPPPSPFELSFTGTFAFFGDPPQGFPGSFVLA